MSAEMTKEAVAALRKPFDKKSVGKLPKGGTTLDYVGHAAVTDRLLAIDPLWSWEPMATDERGLPITDTAGNLWIRLTVCGVTRIGVGDGKSAKEVIGDAIRNAAMRFGVALDLWSKEELESVGSGDVYKATAADNEPRTYQRATPPTADMEGPAQITTKQRGLIKKLSKELDLEDDRPKYLAGLTHYAGRTITSSNDLTSAEAGKVIDALSAAKAARVAESALGAEELPVDA